MIGLLIITHEPIGRAYQSLVLHFFDPIPPNVIVMGIEKKISLDGLIARGEEEIKKLDTPDGVLILTDIFGATPANVALKLLKKGKVLMVTGLNAPMMVKAVQYAKDRTDVAAFAGEIMESAKEGIICVATGEDV